MTIGTQCDVDTLEPKLALMVSKQTQADRDAAARHVVWLGNPWLGNAGVPPKTEGNGRAT